MHPMFAVSTVLFIALSSCRFGSAASSSITAPRFLKDPQTLLSSNEEFKLGFFSATNSTNRYLGIWYTNKDYDGGFEVVWVANRDSPLTDSSGMLRISEDGNLQVLDSQNKIHWSSNVSSKVNSSVAKLLDTGNLVLLPRDGDTGIWQSSEHPTDTILPQLKLVFHKNASDDNLQSWKSSNDPSRGRFRVVRLPRSLPEFAIVEENDKPYWRSGPWNGFLFLGVSIPIAEVSAGFTLVDDHNGTVGVSYDSGDQSILERFVLTYDGRLLQKRWNASLNHWKIVWQSLNSECDVYGKCGAFTLCNPKEEPICSCLKGFVPKKVDEWSKGNWSNGCVRRTPLQCDAQGSNSDKFLQIKQIKVPDYAQLMLASQDNCQAKCSGNCSCFAYSYYPGIGCLLLNVGLIDMQQFSSGGLDLYVRLAHSDLPGEGGKWKVWVAVIVIVSALVFGILMCLLWRWTVNRLAGKGNTTKPMETQLRSMFGSQGSNSDFHDLPFFEFTKLLTATNAFSMSNKLGQGGFGPVYKGVLEDGQEIAVKRLSRVSGQGLEEFMNEVVLISKLQHKNLVRLLGCCVEGEEKLLVYELMPNKSLNAILFDPVYQKMLDWNKRFEIIQGICRGLLYLHRDSRLKIIHRDLKTSNILLDEELNPKISDFGMARIFGSKQDHASTLRVVGTYGYMSPEYAMEGRFSEKSDVYSFGVLLLEVVTGRRNNFQDEESMNLLAHTWKLWSTNNMGTLVDPAIFDPQYQGQISKCVQAGLLCVQESPVDRPTVSVLISMLDVDDVENLPHPKQPGSACSKVCSSDEILHSGQGLCSVNDVSMTSVSGR